MLHHFKRTRTLFLGLVILLTACLGQNAPFQETFDDAGDWRVGAQEDADGQVVDGVYDLLVKADSVVIWTTAGREFGDATYQVEATQVEGPVNNGYGMLFRVDDERDNFYVFEVSGDGYVWIGRYRNGGEGEDGVEPLVGDWWFESDAVNQGLNATNVLRVEAEGSNMVFFVNDQEVGRVSDAAFAAGDIGLMVETLGEGGVRVQFDDFFVTPKTG
ncbi:MAG: hypothetical protein KC425_10840 [Anaerolineales bacterium]|nr:hypothetical protein [Anaerolineales bacterium]